MKKNEINNNCSFHTTEINNQEEAIKLDDITENELGEWEVMFRLESVEDLEKIFSSSKKIDMPLEIGFSSKYDENLGDSK
jgi:hypothetical protein